MKKALVLLSALILSSCGSKTDRVFPSRYNMWDPNASINQRLINIPVPHEECTKNNCIIYNDYGGNVYAYTEAANRISKTKNTVIVMGECDSACTGLIDLIKDHVCITTDITLGFHTDSTGQIPAWYSPWVLAWVTANGGFPLMERGGLLFMDYKDAKNHWRTCSDKDWNFITNGN